MSGNEVYVSAADKYGEDTAGSPELAPDKLAALITSATSLYELITSQQSPGQKPNKKLIKGHAVYVDPDGNPHIRGYGNALLDGKLDIKLPERDDNQIAPCKLMSLTFIRVNNNGARREYGFTVATDLSQSTEHLRDYVHQPPPEAAAVGRDMQMFLDDILASYREQQPDAPNVPLRWLSAAWLEREGLNSGIDV